MSLSIRWKVVGIVAVMASVSLMQSATQGYLAWDNILATNRAANSSRLASTILNAAGVLAVERGSTNAALAAANTSPEQRAAVEKARTAVDAALSVSMETAISTGQDVAAIRSVTDGLNTARAGATAGMEGKGDREAAVWFAGTTRSIEALLALARKAEAAVALSDEATLLEQMSVTTAMAVIAEHLGRQRGIVAGVIAGGAAPTPAQLLAIGDAGGGIAISLAGAQARVQGLSPAVRQAVMQAGAAAGMLEGQLRTVLEAGIAGQPYPVDSQNWFRQASSAIDTVLAQRRLLEAETATMTNNLRIDRGWSLGGALLVVLLGLSLLTLAMLVVSRQVLGPLGDLGRVIESLDRKSGV